MQMNAQSCINIEETIRYLGYKGETPDEMMMEELLLCKEKILQVIEPKFIYRVYELEWQQDELYVGARLLPLIGESIREHLNGCDRVALACATLSAGVDVLIDETQKKDMLHSLMLDALANAAIEEVRLQLETELAKEYEEDEINWQFGIGYGDLPLALQRPFLSLIEAEKEIGVTANESSILVPLKSVSGFIGLKRKDQVTSYSEKQNLAKEVENSVCHEETIKEKHQRTCGKRSCEACSFHSTCSFRRI